jgi:hypothetical protein
MLDDPHHTGFPQDVKPGQTYDPSAQHVRTPPSSSAGGVHAAATLPKIIERL